MVQRIRLARNAHVGLLALVACVIMRAPASCQTLTRLHVEYFVLSSDVARPVVGKPFHLEIVIHVREQLAALQNVVLPSLLGLDILGDESTTQASAGGTTYDERLTVVAHGGGKLTVSPAYMDAIDARDGMPKRFLSNGLTLDIAGPLKSIVPKIPLHAIMLGVLRGIETLVGLAALAILIVLLFRRRRTPPAEPPQPIAAVPVVVPVIDPLAPLRDTLKAVEAEPTRSNALRARHALRAYLGIPSGVTLADALAYPQASPTKIGAALRASERAAFVYDDGLTQAIAGLIHAFREMLT